MDHPWLVVQVKTGQADVHVLRALEGVRRASAPTTACWSSGEDSGATFVRRRASHFILRLWDADDLIDEMCAVYERLPQSLQSEVPLEPVWALTFPEPG
jgi:restriction system protein